MNTLFDTSVWVEHLARRQQTPLVEALELDQAVMHPAILGELLLGGISDSIYSDLCLLPQIPETAATTLHEFIRKNQLAGHGVGWVDASLLYSAKSEKVRLHTLDQKLVKLARRLGLSVGA